MRYLLTSLFCCLLFSLSAFRYGDSVKLSSQSKKNTYNQNCAQATAQTDLDVNNVRARLLIGGDFWWDGNSAGYIVPQVELGEPEVSSIFAGALWMGGFDPYGNLKTSAQQFGTSTGNSDYWPGPLAASTGTTQTEVCKNWDKIFSVRGPEIDLHLAQYAQAMEDNVTYDISTIPKGVIEWPALGNEFFFDIFDFQLPDDPQGLAPFWDENSDGLYTPQFGDYPIIELNGCPEPIYADGMEFWIFNDAGNIHTDSPGTSPFSPSLPLRMEIQAQAFAFATDDELNNMTFTRYKLVNRGQESLARTFLGVWIDADVGCSEDDYVGCDTIRDMMYMYNQDSIDGSSGSSCVGGVATYGDEIPYVGVDIFRGPLVPKVFDVNGELIDPNFGEQPDTLVDLGMSSFLYFNRQNPGSNGSLADPSTSFGIYNLLSGTWADGTPLTIGGTGIGGAEVTKFAFHDEPTDEDGWSMCTANLPLEDRRSLQATGPFSLSPGQITELIIGVPWVPDVEYPCPDMGRLFAADDLAQGMFDSCFGKLEGPDAPDVEWIPQDQKLIGVLTNDDVTSNNSRQEYEEFDPFSSPNFPIEERIYKFEGYIVYQLADQNVTREELNNPSKARIAFQSDLENQAIDLFNWVRVANPIAGSFENPFVLAPFLEVEGKNEGVETSFELSMDMFTGGPLVNCETYFYMAIAYAFNEYDSFDPASQRGQGTPYLEGNRNIRTYSVVPNFITSVSSPGGNERLERISVHPNPIITSTSIGNNNFSNTVKIANLPSPSIVTIYALNGVRVREFETIRNVQAEESSNLRWDLRNDSGVPVTSGAYFIHVQAEGEGERVLKLICVN